MATVIVALPVPDVADVIVAHEPVLDAVHGHVGPMTS